VRMVGGESRKSKSPLAVVKCKAPVNSRRPSPSWLSGTSSENINLKGLTLFIARNVSNNMTSWGNQATCPTRTTTSSENTGEVMVENNSTTTEGRWSPRLGTHALTCRDRRTLSGDRLRFPVDRQLKFADEVAQNCVLVEPSFALNRRVSKVLAHAFNRIGAQHALPCRSMERNRRLPPEAMR